MNNLKTIHEAIKKININAEFAVGGVDIDTCTIEWLNGTTPISKADIQAQFPAVEFDMAMEDLRAKRNRLLAESDYIVTMNLEAGTEIPANWSTYRQNLRDLTEGLTTVEQLNTVVFPAKP
jgi:hypothetical protein